jgi:hypothetical protein
MVQSVKSLETEREGSSLIAILFIPEREVTVFLKILARLKGTSP